MFASLIFKAARLRWAWLLWAGLLHVSVAIAGDDLAAYREVYALNIPNTANFNGAPAGTVYDVDNHVSMQGVSISRIAYWLQLQPTSGGPIQFAFVSVEAFTQNLALIGLPAPPANEFFQRPVRDMEVISNVPGIVTGTHLPGGNLEFWCCSYGAANVAYGGVPNASETTCDFGDEPVSPAATTGYGSFQIHNHDAKQTIIAYNGWGDAGRISDVGLGSQPTGNPDWTGAGNAAKYSVKYLQVLVLPGPKPTRKQVMPLGDSVTEGYSAETCTGGFRDPLYTSLVNGGYNFKYFGASGENPSPAMVQASQYNHGGFSGMLVAQLGTNLDGMAGYFPNGGYWFHNGVDPDLILLHTGTNDISQSNDWGLQGGVPVLLNGRLDALVDKLTTLRPAATVLVAQIIPFPSNNEFAAGNPVLIQFNNAIRNTLVPKYQALGRKVYTADLYSSFLNSSGQIDNTLFVDAAHPNQAGYAKMAAAWYAAIRALPGF